MSLRGVAAAMGAGAVLVSSISLADLNTDASSADASGLGEVVVTAQRREESAQNVGIALSVVSGQALADKAISRTSSTCKTRFPAFKSSRLSAAASRSSVSAASDFSITRRTMRRPSV